MKYFLFRNHLADCGRILTLHTWDQSTSHSLRCTVTFRHLILNAARTSQPCFCCSSAMHLKDAARSLGSVAAIYIPLSSRSRDLTGSEQTSNGRREKVGAAWRTSLFFQQVGRTAPTRINAARRPCVSDRLSQGGCCLCLSLRLFQGSIWQFNHLQLQRSVQ